MEKDDSENFISRIVDSKTNTYLFDDAEDLF